MSTNKPLVSVCMITYNQAEYVQQALKSVLDQVCDFEFEVIVSNDSSSDDSDLLILDLIKKHSNGHKVRYFNQPTNLGMNPNFQFAYGKCIGKYIALCEGDDYWSYPFKLQRQVDYLEGNPNIVLCYHSVDVLFSNGQLIKDYGVDTYPLPEKTELLDMLLFGNYIHTPSVVFRRVVFDFPEYVYELSFMDYYLYVYLGKYGYFYKFSESWAVYRHGVGVHSGGDFKEISNKYISSLINWKNKTFDPVQKRIFELKIKEMKYDLLPSNLWVHGIETYIRKNVPWYELIRILFLKGLNRFL